jgi:uncharacterized protein YjiS (DUF1127 family)
MRNHKAREKRYRAAELELMQVISAGLRKRHLGGYAGDCPSPRELRQFAAGKCDSIQRDRLLAHLSVCDLCIDSMAGLRRRRWVLRTALPFASAIVVIATAAWLWMNQHRALPELNRMATVDLRDIAPTRGRIPGPQTATVRKTSGGLRLVLPVDTEGNYEIEILGQDATATPLLRSSGSTIREDRNVVLDLPADLSNLKAGKYLLALRRDGSVWEYYSLTLE